MPLCFSRRTQSDLSGFYCSANSDPKLTVVTYNDSNLLPIANAVNQLPSVVAEAKQKPSWTRIWTHALGLERLSVSKGESQKKRKKFTKESKSEEESRDLTQDDSNGHFPDGGSCGWIRTNDLVVNSHPLYR